MTIPAFGTPDPSHRRLGHVVGVANQASRTPEAHPQLYGIFPVGLRGDGATIEVPESDGTPRVSVQIAARMGSPVRPGTSPAEAMRQVAHLTIALKVVEHDWFRDRRSDATPGRIVASAADTWTVLGGPTSVSEAASAGAITLRVGDHSSEASLADLRWSLGEVIAYAAAGTRVRQDDVFLSGSPVPPSDQPTLTIGDTVVGEIMGIGRVSASVGRRDLSGLRLAADPSARNN